MPLGKNLVGSQPSLGKNGTRHPVLCGLPGIVHFDLGVREIEGHLPDSKGFGTLKENCLHDGFDDFVVVCGQGHCYSEFPANPFGFAKDHAEHSAVDGIVFTIEHQRADDWTILSETIRTSLALFVTSRIPGQVVVNHRVKVILKVDTLGKTVRGNENRNGDFFT